jgi:hypothetical protein
MSETRKLLNECYRLLGEALELMDERRDLKRRIIQEKNAGRGRLHLIARWHDITQEARELKRRTDNLERRAKYLRSLSII